MAAQEKLAYGKPKKGTRKIDDDLIEQEEETTFGVLIASSTKQKVEAPLKAAPTKASKGPAKKKKLE